MPAGRALWLIPDEAARRRLAAVIDDLARRHHAPRFDPHVTLLAGIALGAETARARALELARRTPAPGVVLTRVSGLPAYYRALFLDVAGADLHALHARAAASMGCGTDPAFRPHASLLYGDLAAPVREAILDQIGRAWDLACTLDRLEVVRVDGHPEDWTVEATMAMAVR